MTGLEHPFVRAYLTRLDALSAPLPPERWAELRTDLEDHLREAMAHTGRDDAAVASLLDRLGPPEDVVAEAGAAAVTAPAPPPPVAAPDTGPGTPRLEAVALTLLVLSILLVATLLLAPVALVTWVVGIVLLVVSSRWTVPDKLVGGLAYGLLGAPLLFASLFSAPFVAFTESCLSGSNPDGTTFEQCTGGPPAWWGWFVGGLAVAAVVLWGWAGRRLLRSARRQVRPAADLTPPVVTPARGA